MHTMLMKRTLLPFVLALITSVAIAQTEFTVNDFTYRVLDDGASVALVGAPAEVAGELVIPPKVADEAKEYTVTEIGERAFESRYALTSVVIPNTVKTISAYAFRYAGNGGSVEEFLVSLGNGVTTICERAFDNCDKIKAFTIPASVTFVEASAFWNMDADIAVTIEDSETPLTLNCSGSFYPIFEVNNTVTAYVGRNIERTGNYADMPTFDENIVSVAFGPKVTAIGDNEYRDRDKLVSATGLTNVVSIGMRAFSDCNNLTTVEIGDKLETLGARAFDHDYHLTSITLPGTLKVIPGITEDWGVFERCYDLATVTLGEGIEEIGSSAFYNVLALEEITIPSTVKRIGRAPFYCNQGNGSAIKRLFLSDSETPLEFANGTSEHNYGYGHITDRKTIDYFYLGRDVTREETSDPLVYGSHYIEIGPKVTDIETLFNNTVEVSNVTVHHVTPIAIGDDAFPGDTYESAILWVPGGTVADYQAADGWKQFKEIKTWSYVINFAAQGHGSIAIDDEVAQGGETMVTRKPNGDELASSKFTVTLTPEKGYELTSLTREDRTEDTQAEEIFAGNASFANPFTVETSANHDVAYVANFAPITYDLAYDLAGGTLPGSKTNPATYTVESNAITLVNPTRSGYIFEGWTGTELTEATKTVTIATGQIGNRSYTATWKPITYSITYDLAGGAMDEGKTTPATYNIESETFTLVNPVRTGYTFEGWTGTELTEATKTVTIAKGHIGNRSFTATWTPNPYKVSFDANQGTGTMARQGFTYDQGQALTANAFTRTGYDFNGWNTKADGSGKTYADKQAVKNLTAKRDAVVKLYAQWKLITYAITYDLDGGALAEGESNPTEYTIESEAITLKNPTKENFDFAGWIGTDLDEPAMELTIAAGSTENRSYTATWTAIVGIKATRADMDNDVYDLNGRKMSNRQLPKGVYIVGGKKLVVNK